MNSTNPRQPRIAVLAAGFSSRLGQDKSLAKVHGIPLLSRLLCKLGPTSSGRILVIAAPRACSRRLIQRLGAQYVSNAQRGEGLSSSVRQALRHARYAPALLLLPVDLPALRTAEIDALLSRWRGHRRKVIARRLGQRGVTPLILPKRYFSLGEHLSGDTGLRDLISGLPQSELILIGMPSADADVDTAQQLARARRRFDQ